MKGIILAGGTGSRLYPITKGVSKQLVPIFDKPMIYYPLSILMLAGIRDVLIITSPDDQHNFMRLLGDGSDLGMRFSYKVQKFSDGVAQAIILGEDFIGDENVCLVLGDNIFYGHNLSLLLERAVQTTKEENITTIFGYHVQDPKSYGVVEFDLSLIHI